MKKKIVAVFICLTMLVSSVAAAFAADSGSGSNWFATKSDTRYSIDDSGVITSDDAEISTGKGKTDFYILNDFEEKENYTVSVTTSGTMALPNTKVTRMGLVPYYVDDYNYIMCYLEWSSTDRPNDIRCVQFTGYINGQHIGWNNTWLDNVRIPSTEEFAFEVTKTGDTFMYTVSTGSKVLANSALEVEGLESVAAVGVMASNDTITFTDFALNVDNEVKEVESDGDWIETTGNDHYTLYTDGTIISDDAEIPYASGATNFYVLNDFEAKDNYTVSVTASGTMELPNTKKTRMGIVPYYVDDNNYIIFSLEWSNTDRETDIRTVQFTGFIDGKNIGYNNTWLDGVQIPSTEEFIFEVTKTGNTFAYTVSTGDSVLANKTLTVEGLESEATVGVLAQNDIITFTDFTFEENLIEVGSDGNWKETTQDDHYTLYTNGVIKSDNAAISNEKGNTNFYILDNEVFGDSYTVSVAAQGTMKLPNTKEMRMGLVPYYVDDDNYIIVYIEWSNTDRANDVRQVQFTGYINGEHIGYNNYWSDGVHIPSTKGFDITVTRSEDTFSFSVSTGSTIIESGLHQVEGLQNEAKVGVMAYNDTVTFRDFKTMKDGLTFDGKTTYETEETLWTETRTVSTWIYLPKSYTKAAGEIFSNYNEAVKENMGFGISENGQPHFYYTNANGRKTEMVFSGVDVCTSEWVHLAFVVDDENDKVSCYVDGILVETKKSSVDIVLEDIDVPLVFAGDLSANANVYFTGHIREAALYNEALTATEIAELYTNGVKTESEKLLAYYDLENAEFDTDIPDLAGNGNDVIAKPWYFTEKDPVTDYAYSFVVVGDTQIINYNDVQRGEDNLACIYNWIVENEETKNIQYVFGLGDITDKNSTGEWLHAAENFKKLDEANIPYSVIRGNHDLPGLYGGDPNVDTLTKYLGTDSYLEQFADGGFYGEDNIINSWRTLTVGEIDYLMVTLDYGASDEVLAWASEVIADHPNHNVIITTHAYKTLDGTTLDDNDAHSPAHGGYKSGENMWDKLISKHENIVLVMSGHIGTTNVMATTDVGDNGNVVTSLLIDPQDIDVADGSTGMITMLYFSEDGKKIQVETYSTVKGAYYKDLNQFSLEIPVIERVSTSTDNNTNTGNDANVGDNTNTGTSTNKGESVKTGDTSHSVVYIFTGIVAVAAMAVVIYTKKKREYNL